MIFILFSLGIGMVVEYALLTLAVGFGYAKAPELQRFAATNTVYVAIRQSVWFTFMLGFLYLTLRPRVVQPFWVSLGWREPRARDVPRPLFYAVCFLGGFVLALAVSYVSHFFMPQRPLPIQALFQDRQSAYLMAVLGVLVAPLVEETIFRGFLYPVFARSLGAAAAVLLTGALFGMVHGAQLGGVLPLVALLGVVGCVFTVVRARTGSVIPCYFLHLGYNSILFVGFFFSQEFRRLPLVR